MINPKPTVSLNFNENNPLNYVRPITVNLYFKQDNPGVGKYNSIKKFGDTKTNYCKAAFIKGRNDKGFELGQNNGVPDPGQYNIPTNFDSIIQTRDQITANFQPPVPRKIYPVNLYDPHRPVSPKFKSPGPCDYNTANHSIKERTKVDPGYLNSVKLSSNFVQENTDRFGNAIYPLTSTYDPPGPPQYDPDLYHVKKKVPGIAFSTADRKIYNDKALHEKQFIGPGCYNSNVEPKKISFFLNQGDKWVS